MLLDEDGRIDRRTKIFDAGDEVASNDAPVEVDTNKFAVLIGNSESNIAGAAPSFALSDVEFLKSKLVQFGGYSADNITTLTNVTAANISESIRNLAAKLPDNATVFLYFTGAGYNVDGKDYLAGSNTAMTTDTSTMLEKSQLFQPFMSKGCRIFSFFQVHRPVIGGRYFGQEVPMLGSISQMMATIPGGEVRSKMKSGQEIGLFTEAVALVLNDLHTNKIPIMEFGWQVFDRIKRGDTGTLSGGATQVPTLPMLTNMAPDARF